MKNREPALAFVSAQENNNEEKEEEEERQRKEEEELRRKEEARKEEVGYMQKRRIWDVKPISECMRFAAAVGICTLHVTHYILVLTNLS